jgi:hypothetical protein
MTEFGARIAGGMTHEEARALLAQGRSRRRSDGSTFTPVIESDFRAPRGPSREEGFIPEYCDAVLASIERQSA